MPSSPHPTVIQMIEARIQRTELYAAMIACGRYRDSRDCIDAILCMREAVRAGDDPAELLHEEGFEPDYIFDIIE